MHDALADGDGIQRQTAHGQHKCCNCAWGAHRLLHTSGWLSPGWKEVMLRRVLKWPSIEGVVQWISASGGQSPAFTVRGMGALDANSLWDWLRQSCREVKLRACMQGCLFFFPVLGLTQRMLR